MHCDGFGVDMDVDLEFGFCASMSVWDYYWICAWILTLLFAFLVHICCMGLFVLLSSLWASGYQSSNGGSRYARQPYSTAQCIVRHLKNYCSFTVASSVTFRLSTGVRTVAEQLRIRQVRSLRKLRDGKREILKALTLWVTYMLGIVQV